MKKFLGAAAIAATLLMASCTSVTPLCATGNPIGSKVGEASVNYLFSAIPMTNYADLGIQEACRNGGITKVSIVDQKVHDICGFWKTVTTVVVGD